MYRVGQCVFKYVNTRKQDSAYGDTDSQKGYSKPFESYGQPETAEPTEKHGQTDTESKAEAMNTEPNH